jgi:flagellar biosynthesis/type III secretory pathway chaperone
MKQKWEELLVVLNQILSVYKAILALSRQKKQILVAAKSHELDKVVKQEEVLILQLGKLEDLRGKIVSELMAAHHITSEEVSFTQLQSNVAPDIAIKLNTFSEEFDVIMTELAPLNKLNTELVTQALGFINYNINILSQTVVGPTYAPKGQANEQRKRTVFDARA